jgi:ESS family glutamate:Na+ symporter
VGAGTLALTSATFGIVCGGLTGTPVGTWLIHRYHLAPSALPGTREAREEPHGPQALVVPTDREDPPLILNMIVLAAAMGLGSILSRWFAALEWTLPAYIGAMIIASIFRNVDDRTGWLKIDPVAMDFVGGFALNIFLVVALMDLKLWQLAGQALPLFVILAAQVVLVAIFALTASFLVMGRDYDSAVMSAGFVGFVLGTTANAVANMRALVTRYGPAPRAFLVVPLVGAFFIDFANAIIITFYVNWLR